MSKDDARKATHLSIGQRIGMAIIILVVVESVRILVRIKYADFHHIGWTEFISGMVVTLLYVITTAVAQKRIKAAARRNGNHN